MDNLNYFEGLCKAIPDCRKKVIIIFLFKDDKKLLKNLGLV